MKNADSCPSKEACQLFIAGKLDESSALEIITHLESCSVCEQTICGMERQDTIADKFYDACQLPDPENEAFLQELQYAQLSSRLRMVVWSQLSHEDSNLIGLGGYVFGGLIGQGGMGTVYRAIHSHLKRPVAVKVLSANMFGEPEAVARFEREIIALGTLSHPNIVQANDAGEENGQHYLVMELVEGKDLSKIVKEAGRLKISDAVLLTIQAAQGLQYAHQKGIIHRDIKPSNLMLSAGSDSVDAHVKILDLGLARALDFSASDLAHGKELSTTGRIMGTLDYMAPEQINDASRVDSRTDIYALGATLYKLLTGEVPFAAQSKLPLMERLLFIAANDPTPVCEKRPEVPAEVSKTVRRMLARSPEDRFTSAQDIIHALRPYSVGADLSALLTGKPSCAAESNLQLTLPEAKRTANPARTRFALFLCALAGTLLLGVVLSAATRNGTMTVASSSGLLPQDLQIVVTKDGDEVALLHADNKWSIKIVTGEYDLHVVDGNGQIEIRDRRIKIHRLGNSVVTIDILPAKSLEPGLSPSLADGAPSLKPFRIVRQGKNTRDYATLPGTFEDLKTGDVIEILSNDRLAIHILEPVTKPLLIRAGDGYRPVLDFPDHHAVRILGDFIVEGCDLDFRSGPFQSVDAQSSWEFHNCRIWGTLAVSGTTARIVNSILVGGGIGVLNQHRPVYVVFENSLIRHMGPFLTTASPDLQVTVKDCTFHSIGHGCTGFFHDHPHNLLPPNAKVTINASGNVFNYNLHYPELIPKKFQPQVTWTGRENLFVGNWQEQWEEVDGEWKLTDHGLSLWNKWLSQPEQGSSELPAMAMEWGRIQRLPASEFLLEVKQFTEQVKQQTAMHNLGPDWNLVGPGDAYIRALEAAGRPINAEKLRTERLADGPITLIRAGEQDRGFFELREALDAALDGDVIEFRTDGVVPSAAWTGDNRLLTLRAAPGYSPQVESLQSLGSDRLIIEGLTIQHGLLPSSNVADNNGFANGGPLFQGAGSIVRIANCRFLTGSLSGSFSSINERTPEIVNCQFSDRIDLELRPNQVLHIRNCIFQALNANLETVDSEKGRVIVEHSTFFRPESTSLLDNRHVIASSTAVQFQFDHCLFNAGVPYHFLPAKSGSEPTWAGDYNVYMHSYSSIHSRTLDDLRAKYHGDLHSTELLPWEFDPAQWRILREATPGYNPKADGTDYGAQIDELINAMN